jgi:dephospho-CoA kinase
MNKPIHFIGVSGPALAGKDTAADIIAELFGAENLATGEIFRVMTRFMHRLPYDVVPPRDQIFPVATFLREMDPAFSIKFCMEQAKVLGIERIVMSGLRSIYEAEAIQQHGGLIVGVTAEPHIRYERLQSRARDAEGSRTYEAFLKQDTFENLGVDGRGITSIIEHADVVIDNSGDSLEGLKTQIREKLTPFLG